MATSRLFYVLLVVLPVAVHCRTPLHRIVGGSDAADGAYPWQLSLRNLGSHSCGASLIGSRIAVCAAHCVGSAVVSYSLIAGTNQRSCPNDDCVTIRPSAATRHPDFVNSGAVGYPNDVSVLTWDSPVEEVEGKVKFIDITTSVDWTGKECFITGWGRISGGGILPENLQEAVIDVITNDECISMWSAAQIRASHVCIYDKDTQARGACNGDSGGPLVCREPGSQTWELIGATSWGRTGCSTAYPSVYTRVSSFKDWIEQQIPA